MVEEEAEEEEETEVEAVAEEDLVEAVAEEEVEEEEDLVATKDHLQKLLVRCCSSCDSMRHTAYSGLCNLIIGDVQNGLKKRYSTVDVFFRIFGRAITVT